jgi:hypothetical protein
MIDIGLSDVSPNVIRMPFDQSRLVVPCNRPLRLFVAGQEGDCMCWMLLGSQRIKRQSFVFQLSYEVKFTIQSS